MHLRNQVSHDVRNIVAQLYNLSNRFPSSEKFELMSQIRRAAISIISKIVKGSSRTSLKDRAHFYQIAFSSNIEVLKQLIIAVGRKYIDQGIFKDARSLIEIVSNKINSLRNLVKGYLFFCWIQLTCELDHGLPHSGIHASMLLLTYAKFSA